MREITKKDIKDLAPKRIVERGYGYFEKEYVSNPITFKERLVAEVTGRRNYKTRVDFIGDEIKTSCTCPYDGLVCKHAIAL
ncbi:MAG: SWIM zinc finger domain-containing protein, partial [Candidatus Methanofastidiosia archaeon]